MNGLTTISIGTDTRDNLGELQLLFRRARGGRVVGADDTIRFLIAALGALDTRTYLQLLGTYFGQGEARADERDHHGPGRAEAQEGRNITAAAVPAGPGA